MKNSTRRKQEEKEHKYRSSQKMKVITRIHIFLSYTCVNVSVSNVLIKTDSVPPPPLYLYEPRSCEILRYVLKRLQTMM